MELKWANKAFSDLVRLYEFLEPVNAKAAAQVVQSLTSSVTRLTKQPRMGEVLQEFQPREVRRLLVGRYEVRYEIRKSAVFVIRLWHTRENR